jgi:hypothetical protein
MSSTHNPTTYTFEQLMASFRESREEMKEMREKSRIEREESREKWEKARIEREESRKKWEKEREKAWEDLREMREQQKETARIVKATSEQIAKLGDRLGELVQAMVEGGIKRMFKELGYEFDVLNPEYEFGNKKIGFGEIDILLENGEFALLVEVKTNLTVKDVKEHQKRVKKFRLWTAPKGDKRRFLAAIGGGVVKKSVQEFALKQGMFVIQQSGENVEIIPPDGKPKVW